MAKKVPLKQESTLSEAERLTEEILDVILSLAALDFSKTVRVGYEDTNFNAVAAGLNMLGQELQRSVVSKEFLEKQVKERTKELSEANRLLNLEIEERRHAEAEVSAREQKYRNIFESTAVALLEEDFSEIFQSLEALKAKGILDLKSYLDEHVEVAGELLAKAKIIDVNSATLKMFEADSKEILIENFNDLFLPESADVFRRGLVALMAGSGNFNTETIARSMKGRRINILLQVQHRDVIPNVLVSITNVTEQRGLEEQLRQSQKMEAIGRLAGGVAHDFNNLLTVILNYGQMAADELPAVSPLRKKIDAILDCGNRAASLTQQLLAFSRKQMIEPKVLDLNNVLTRMEKMLRRLLGEDIELINKMDPSIGMVVADAGQIEQIAMNLAVNARDAMPKGGKLIIETRNEDLDLSFQKVHAEIREGHYVMFAISDTGTGMTPEVMSRIYEPFFTTKEVGKGTGLGLSTVYGNVKQNGGHILVYSEVGHGTTFKVYLPRIEERNAAGLPMPSLKEISEGHETVLLVEDEDVVREVASALLRRHGYNVIEAKGPMEAIDISSKHQDPLHLLLTDVIMPKMNGRMLADKLLKARPGLRVLFMSGYTDNAITHNGILEQGTAFLQKPFMPKNFLAKVREVLDMGQEGSKPVDSV